MATIKGDFEINKGLLDEGWSTWAVFCAVIRNKRCTPRAIREAFNELVDKEDYDKGDKKYLLEYLYTL